mgnify:CR=1 FL=1
MNYMSRAGVEYKAASKKEVVNNVLNHYGLNDAQLRSKTRLRHFVDARTIISYLLTEKGNTLSETGKLMNRSHCNTLHLRNKAKNIMSYDKEFKELVMSFK